MQGEIGRNSAAPARAKSKAQPKLKATPAAQQCQPCAPATGGWPLRLCKLFKNNKPCDKSCGRSHDKAQKKEALDAHNLATQGRPRAKSAPAQGRGAKEWTTPQQSNGGGVGNPGTPSSKWLCYPFSHNQCRGVNPKTGKRPCPFKHKKISDYTDEEKIKRDTWEAKRMKEVGYLPKAVSSSGM